MRALGIQRLSAYVHLIESSEEERRSLLKELTIHVTDFFRDEEVFIVIEDRVLPEIIRRQKDRRYLQILSAGASTGEEALSIAILVDRALKDCLKEWKVRIHCIDIDEGTLLKAKQARYRRIPVFRGQTLNSYFTPHPDGGFVAIPRIRDMIRFLKWDVAKSFPGPKLQMVLCRNTLIYYNKERQDTIHGAMAQSLEPEGFLVLGMTEMLTPYAQGWFEVFDSRTHVYRRLLITRRGNP